jgi:hypothetical protein
MTFKIVGGTDHVPDSRTKEQIKQLDLTLMRKIDADLGSGLN